MNQKQVKALRRLARSYGRDRNTQYVETQVGQRLEYTGKLNADGTQQTQVVPSISRTVSHKCTRGLYRQLKRHYKAWDAL